MFPRRRKQLSTVPPHRLAKVEKWARERERRQRLKETSACYVIFEELLEEDCLTHRKPTPSTASVVIHDVNPEDDDDEEFGLLGGDNTSDECLTHQKLAAASVIHDVNNEDDDGDSSLFVGDNTTGDDCLTHRKPVAASVIHYVDNEDDDDKSSLFGSDSSSDEDDDDGCLFSKPKASAKRQKREEHHPKEIGPKVFDVLRQEGYEYLDIQTLTNCCRTNNENCKKWRTRLEPYICKYFLLTKDAKLTAERVVEGGWTVWIEFLALVAHCVQKTFDSLGVRPPPLYRAVLAQQAMYAMDGDGIHPLLFGNYHWAEDQHRQSWFQQETDDDEKVEEERICPRRHPTFSICFRQSSRGGRLLLPSTNQEHDPENETSRRLLAQRMGMKPYVCLAFCGTGKVVLTGNMTSWRGGVQEASLMFVDFTSFSPISKQIIGTGNGSITSWLFASSDTLDESEKFSLHATCKLDLLAWSLLAKRLGVAPFCQNFKLEDSLCAMEQDNTKRWFPFQSQESLGHRAELESLVRVIGRLELIS